MRKTFANTIRKDLKVETRGRRTTVSGNGLSYSTTRRNAGEAAYLNSKIPLTTVVPPFSR